MDPIGLVFLGLMTILLIAAIIVPQMQNRNNDEQS